MLDKRLKLCAEFVSGKGVVCDVGTDHAYLAVELIKSGKCGKVIASDVKEGPLKAARKNVERYGVSDKVELVLSDGLENINLNGVTDIVVAGMGGETIVNILEDYFYENCLEGIQLILQPMSKPEMLREFLYNLGYMNISERAVEDSYRIYTVICVKTSNYQPCQLTEYESVAGFFDEDDETGKRYRQKKAEKFAKISESLEKAGKTDEAVHYRAMSRRLAEGIKTESIYDIYEFLDRKYSFSLQEKWDNSGLLVENTSMMCRKILLTLDITDSTVDEAKRKGAELIISHHPVIFNPLKKIENSSPVFELIKNDISAICMHTNLDIAEGGTNSVIVEKIIQKCGKLKNTEYLEDLGNGTGLGYVIELENNIAIREFVETLKDIFGLENIRMSKTYKKFVSRIAICSGSGGSLLRLAIEKRCDAFVTGDVKHDVWIDANNNSFTVFDCGHFHTENIVLWELRRVLEKKFPLLDIEISENSTVPFINPDIYFRGEE